MAAMPKQIDCQIEKLEGTSRQVMVLPGEATLQHRGRSHDDAGANVIQML